MLFKAIEYAIPSEVVTNQEILNRISDNNKDLEQLDLLLSRLEQLFDKSKTSIRYHRGKDEQALQFGVEAGLKALQSAKLAPEDIGLLIYVGVGRGYIEPATANIFQKTLNLVNATCFDILDACASWLRALHIADAFLKSNAYNNILILNCEFNFREYVDFKFKSINDIEHNFPIFTIGEAATATILSKSDEDIPYYSTFKTWGNGHSLCKIPLPNFNEYSDGEIKKEIEPLIFFSYGEKLFKFAFSRLVKHYLEDSNLRGYKPDIIFSHAASDAMSEKMVETLNLDMNTAYFSHRQFGNTVSASVPLAMSRAIQEGRLINGSNVLIGFGSAGVSTAWSKLKFYS